MTLTVNSLGDNPQQPGITADAYIPDQLIAGPLQLVTDSITLTGAAVLQRGSVLGKVTLGTGTAAAKAGGNTGNGTITMDATTPVLANALAGVYTARCIAAATNSGTFEIKGPDGKTLGEYVVGATFSDQLKFVIADGSTDFIVGDGFDITIAAGSGSYKLAASASVDGSAVPAAILADYSDASGGDVVAPIYIMGEFNGAALTLGSGITLAAAKAALRPIGIHIKTSVSAADPT